MDSLYASGIRVSQLLSLLAILFLLVLLFCRERSRPHPTLAAGRAASVLTLVLAVPVLLYTLHIIPFSGLIPALSGRLALLSLFSILSLLSLFLLYGRSAPSEVLYANHPD